MGSLAGGRYAAPPEPPAFRDRAEAGALLGARLREVLAPGERPAGDATADYPERSVAFAPSPSAAAGPAGARPVILALPRGGVPVAAEAARVLGAPLDILAVRKIGHPAAPELGLGAIAEDGAGGATGPCFDPELLSRVGLASGDLAGVVARERAELARRVAVYAGRRPALSLAGRLAVVVDDGLATGVTARTALRAVRARGARRAVLAVPVAPAGTAGAMQKEAGEVVTLVTPRRLRSVGEWYADFSQLTDDDVLLVLARAWWRD